MAATSHDFWLHNLSPAAWKRLHMFVYAAYALLVAHITLGALQSERSPVLAAVMAAGLGTLLTLHLLAARKENRTDKMAEPNPDGFVDVCAVSAIPENRAAIVCIGSERVAVFRYEGKLSAISNVCQHQNGPLGEGSIVHGCVTCPWHGYQYKPETGAAPPPFTEKVATFQVRVRDGRVQVDPRPYAPGTYVEPARLNAFDTRNHHAQLSNS
jgi:nitrite reductase/ring-hydroxylating ferredoxin subunit